jgi:7-keto-8-aminopelargonate synthetase-like enzyme
MSEPFRFAGNDYLGLATHPALIDALCDAARRYGISSTSSRWAQGLRPVHEELEHELALWMGSEDACIFGAAYFGGAIYYGRMAARGCRTVFCDETVHSNQFLGMRAAGMEIRTFKHLDVADLRRITAGYQGAPAIVATDGVYGISGEVAPIAEIAAVARTLDAELFVDDAHGVGAIGPHSRGAADLCGIQLPGAEERGQRPRLQNSPVAAAAGRGEIYPKLTVMGSMSKALGANGGFLAGRKELVDLFRRSPEASGSSIPPPAIAAAALAAVRIVTHDPEPRRRMEANAVFMRQTLRGAGIALVEDRHPILGMLLANEGEAVALDQHFRKHGIWIPYFKYASEPRHNLLRGAARALYTPELLERFAEAVKTRPR